MWYSQVTMSQLKQSQKKALRPGAEGKRTVGVAGGWGCWQHCEGGRTEGESNLGEDFKRPEPVPRSEKAMELMWGGCRTLRGCCGRGGRGSGRGEAGSRAAAPSSSSGGKASTWAATIPFSLLASPESALSALEPCTLLLPWRIKTTVPASRVEA